MVSRQERWPPEEESGKSYGHRSSDSQHMHHNMSSLSGRVSREFFTPPPQMILQRSYPRENDLPNYQPGHRISRDFLHPSDVSWRRRDHFIRKDRPQFLTPQPQLIRSYTDFHDVSVLSEREFPYQSSAMYVPVNECSYLVHRPQLHMRGDNPCHSRMPSFDIDDSQMANDIDNDTMISSVSQHVSRNKRESRNGRNSQSPVHSPENSVLDSLRYKSNNFLINKSRPYVDEQIHDDMYAENPQESLRRVAANKKTAWNDDSMTSRIADDDDVRVGRVYGSDIGPRIGVLRKSRDNVESCEQVHNLDIENLYHSASSNRIKPYCVDMVPLSPSKYYSGQNIVALNHSQLLTKENVEMHDKLVNSKLEEEQVSNTTASRSVPMDDLDYMVVDPIIHESVKENSLCGSKQTDAEKLSDTFPKSQSLDWNNVTKEDAAQHGILTNLDNRNSSGAQRVVDERDNMSMIKSLYGLDPNNMDPAAETEEDVEEVTMLLEEPEKEADESNEGNITAINTMASEDRASVEEGGEAQDPQQETSPLKLYNWIIKTVPQVKGVSVEGKRRVDDEDYWETGVVIRRHGYAVVENKSGNQYQLMGNIDIEDADCGGFDDKTITKFVKGFPNNWMKIIANFYKSENQGKKPDPAEKENGILKGTKGTKANKKCEMKTAEKEIQKYQKVKKTTKVKEKQQSEEQQKSSKKAEESKVSKNVTKNDRNLQREVKQKAVGTKEPKDTQKKTYILKEWIIKPVDHCQGICVEGKLSYLEKDEFWHSSPILERINSRTLLSASGTCYKLVGPIEKLEALEHGFNTSVVKAFRNGFPSNWKQIVGKHFLLRRGVKKTKDTDAPVTSNVTQDHQFYTPIGNKVQLDRVQRTRSGRAVKPMVGWWMGQRLQIDQNTGEFELKCLTEHALKVSSEVSMQYLAVQGKQKSEGNKSFNRSNLEVTEKGNKKLSLNNTVCHEEKKDPKNNSTTHKATEKQEKRGKENRNTEKKSCSKLREENELEKEVLGVLNESRKRRSNNKMRRSTCYNEDRKAEIKLKERSSIYDIEDSESDEDKPLTRSKQRRTSGRGIKEAIDKKTKTSKSAQNQESCMKEERPTRRSARNLSKVVCYNESNSLLEDRNENRQKLKRHGRSKSRSKSGGRKDEDKEGDRKVIEKGENSKMKVNQTGQQRKSGLLNQSSERNAGIDKEEPVAKTDKWKTDEVIRFTKILKTLEPDDVEFWDKICAAVKTRSVSECQDYYYRDVPEHQKKLTERKANTKSQQGKQDVKELTAKAGTLKRKQQLRDIVENATENYADDLFDSTPFRKYSGAKSAGRDQEEEEDVFAELAAKNVHLRNKIFTPLTRLDVRPASTSKTPASQLQIDTPVYNRKKIDQYTRLANLKRRRLVNQTKRLKTPLHKPKKIGTGSHHKGCRNKKNEDLQSLFVTDYNSDENHADSDQDEDFYFSDH